MNNLYGRVYTDSAISRAIAADSSSIGKPATVTSYSRELDSSEISPGSYNYE
ncbi:MAG: hypothetical protein JW920_07755 [Deltaproteobacteria bacterium]|nr:hypothetical protein [Deltaproteobacteria bacterium]